MVERARTVVCDSVALSLCCCFTGSSASRGGEQQGVAPPGGGQGLARGAGGVGGCSAGWGGLAFWFTCRTHSWRPVPWSGHTDDSPAVCPRLASEPLSTSHQSGPSRSSLLVQGARALCQGSAAESHFLDFRASPFLAFRKA